MASERLPIAFLVCALCACGGSERFPVREPLWRDPDQHPFAPAPEEYVSPFAWDGANQIMFRPIARFFAVDPAGAAINVNALDEVPDSSWFENRIGRNAITAEELVRGPCGEQELGKHTAPGSWIIDQGKPNGANPGFRVDMPDVGKFMLKADPAGEPDRATGATAIAARFYHAAGFFAPCDSVVYFDPVVLKLEPGLEVTDNTGVTRPFDQPALNKVLAGASHREGQVRMGASRWLPGKPLGPYRYEGTRGDDPNDVVDHEDRRELRGARLLAAWLNHFDTREQNTMDVFMADASDPKKERGHVRHYILDLGDCFGSVWASERISRRLGHAYYLDFPYLAEDFVTFGAIERPWDRAQRTSGIFNYFSARDFDPELWRGGYPNPAFIRMTEGDAAWMARIIARFSDELIGAAVSVGRYDDQSAAFLTRTLITRRDIILRRYLRVLSPVTDLRVSGHSLCGVDLARKTRVVSDPRAPFSVSMVDDGEERALPATAIDGKPSGELCIDLRTARSAFAGGSTGAEYMVLKIDNGDAEQPLHAHVYSSGRTGGFKLVGIERE